MKHSTTARMAAAAVFAAAFLSAPAASAAPPSGPPADLFYDLPAGDGCSFRLIVKGTDSKRHTKEFFDKNGLKVRVIEAGKGFNLTYTNFDNKKSISFKGNGSVTKTSINNVTKVSTVTATGHNGLILFPSDVPKGPTSVQYTGRIVYTIDAKGVFTLQSTSGTKVDICEALK